MKCDLRSMPLNPDERRATAFHEAGHVVISVVHGRIPTSADIIPDANGNAGHTLFENEDIPEVYRRYLNASPEKQRYIEMRVLVSLAGTAAHDLMSPGRQHDCGDLRDEKQAKKLIGECINWEDDHDAAFSRLKTECSQQISENWPKVEVVASELLRKDKILAAEIQFLVGHCCPDTFSQ